MCTFFLRTLEKDGVVMNNLLPNIIKEAKDRNDSSGTIPANAANGAS